MSHNFPPALPCAAVECLRDDNCTCAGSIEPGFTKRREEAKMKSTQWMQQAIKTATYSSNSPHLDLLTWPTATRRPRACQYAPPGPVSSSGFLRGHTGDQAASTRTCLGGAVAEVQGSSHPRCWEDEQGSERPGAWCPLGRGTAEQSPHRHRTTH